MKTSRFSPITLALFIVLALWMALQGSLSLAAASLSSPAVVSPPAPPDVPEPPIIGEPCGLGERLPIWTLCLYGTVSVVGAAGEGEPLAGIPITISRGTSVVTATTLVRRGQSLPTFAVDISPLTPTFLHTVTLTANLSGTLVARDIVVFPDFRTMNQRYDLPVHAVGVLDPNSVWGYVVDFESGGPVAGAEVVLTNGRGTMLTTTTVLSATDALPVYRFGDLLGQGMAATDTLYLTARYGGDSDQQVTVLGEEEAQQVNLVTGWKCEQFNPLPQTGGMTGLPQTGGMTGLPDVACFWGYGVVDGIATAGMQVQVAISDTLYEAQTLPYPGETLPRFGIGVWGTALTTGQRISITGVYSGFASSKVFTVALGANLSQQVDVQVAEPDALAMFQYQQNVQDIVWHNGYVWAAREFGGVVRWDPEDGSTTIYTSENSGLVGEDIQAVAVDNEGYLWFGAFGWHDGISRYHPDTGEWLSFPEGDGLTNVNVRDIFVDSRGVVWVGTAHGVFFYDDTIWQALDERVVGDAYVNVIVEDEQNNLWIGTSNNLIKYDVEEHLWRAYTEEALGGIDAIFAETSGNIWFGGYNEILRYNFLTEAWSEYNTLSAVSDIEEVTTDTMWFSSSTDGVAVYHLSENAWQFITTTHGLQSNQVSAITLDDQNNLWFGTLKGLSRYIPTSGAWRNYATGATGIGGNDVEAIVVDQTGKVWTNAAGISRYDPITDDWLTLTIADGLASDNVHAIAVDRANILWFGTGRGLNSYDANNELWQTFTTSHGLVYTYVQGLAIDHEGDLWVGTGRGINHYIPSTNKWYQYTDDKTGLPGDHVNALLADETGKLWFGTDDGSGYHIDDLNAWRVYFPFDGLVNEDVNAIARDHQGNIWFGTDGGVSRYNPTSERWDPFIGVAYLPSNDVRAITVDSRGHVWIGTTGGVSEYDPLQESWHPLTMAQGLVNNFVQAITVDAANHLWFGTQGGISRYNPFNRTWQNFLLSPTLPDDDVEAILYHTDGSLWFGTDSAGLVHYTPGVEPLWETFGASPTTLLDDDVATLVMAPDGKIWIGTREGANRYDPRTHVWERFTVTEGLVNKRVQTISLDSQGSVWIGTTNGISRRRPSGEWDTYTAKTTAGLLSNDVESVTVDKTGAIWFSTRSKGVSRFKPDTYQWQRFTTADGLAKNAVTSIVTDDSGNIWFGTTGSGVSQYSVDSDVWQTYSTTHGLADNYVDTIAIDEQDTVWFGTRNGLSRYTPSNDQWRTFTQTHGLPDEDVYSIAVDEQGNLWLGTLNGGLVYWEVPDPESDLTLRLTAPTAVLAGQPFSYTLDLTNRGQQAALDTQLTLTLPTSATIVGTSIPPSSWVPLRWNLGTLPADGSSVALIVTVTLDSALAPGTSVATTAQAASRSPETFHLNNHAQATTRIRDPYRADLRLSLAGPALLTAERPGYLIFTLDNWGGLAAAESRLAVTLPPDVGYVSASIPPDSEDPLHWSLGTLPPTSSPSTIGLTITLHSDAAPALPLAISALLTTTTPESDLTNNQAAITLATSLTDTLTLILVAPERQAARYGVSPVMARLYTLAAHPLVNGVVLNVEQSPRVREAFAAWDMIPGDVQRANAVVSAIKVLIDEYTITYPSLRYLLFIGGDDLLPFYRVLDRNPTPWQERGYARHTAPSTVRAALAANYILTDDFYADREPTYPTSSEWPSGLPLYLPDFASGRLVQTPADILASLDAFLAGQGTVTLGPTLVAGDQRLSRDLVAIQCQTLELPEENAPLCLTRGSEIRHAIRTERFGSIWAALHSNHDTFDRIPARQLLELPPTHFQDTFLVSIGCHAGLSVPESTGEDAPDLPQAFLRRGATYIASTAYAYATPLSLSYSEQFALELSREVAAGGTLEVGTALVRAKQRYYLSRGWFDALDEKVLLPLTLYGFPMMRIEAAAQPLAQNGPTLDTPTTTVTRAGITRLNYQFDPTYTYHTTPDGNYYAYEGQILLQEGLPAQPTHPVTLAKLPGITPRGTLLHFARFRSENEIDPLMGEAWAIGEEQEASRRLVSPAGWDRPLPYSFTRFEGITGAGATLNLIMGAYHGSLQEERLIRNLSLETLYSSSPDQTPPTILSYSGQTKGEQVSFAVTAQDDTQVTEAWAVCDNGRGVWQSQALTLHKQSWIGACFAPHGEFYLQLVDVAGNVTTTPWLVATP